MDIQENKKPIFRFKFSDSLLEKITTFSQTNKESCSKMFRHNFDNFMIENREMVNKEKEKYDQYGYKGDIEEKIYRSARYYFKNKETKNTISNNSIKTEKQKRRNYIKRDEVFIEAVHEHAVVCVRNNVKPSVAFSEFIEHTNYKNLYLKEYRRVNTILEDDKATLAKIKKTYKNIYFTIKRDS